MTGAEAAADDAADGPQNQGDSGHKRGPGDGGGSFGGGLARILGDLLQILPGVLHLVLSLRDGALYLIQPVVVHVQSFIQQGVGLFGADVPTAHQALNRRAPIDRSILEGVESFLLAL